MTQPTLAKVALVLGTPLLLMLGGCMSAGTHTTSGEPNSATLAPHEREEARQKILAMRDQALQDLYRQNPAAREEIEKAAGYAVIDTSGINVILLVEANGHGLLVNQRNGKETFIRMLRLGTGPGLGYVNYRQVMVFKNDAVFEQFAKLGVDVSAQGNATFKPGGKGQSLDDSTSFTPYLSIYQLTDSGVLMQANWGGTKYIADDQLNE